MTCPVCFEKCKCIETREDCGTVYRLYKCKSCGYRLGTIEEDADYCEVRKSMSCIVKKLYGTGKEEA